MIIAESGILNFKHSSKIDKQFDFVCLTIITLKSKQKRVFDLLISKPKIPLDLYNPTHLLINESTIQASSEIEE